jgi:Brix domain
LDHVLSFNIADNRIWFRNYQINIEPDGKDKKTELYEIGPRFLLNPIVILDGNLSGEVLYQNPDYESKAEVNQNFILFNLSLLIFLYLDRKKKKKRIRLKI